jgi:SAM-dependent methyltransferase
MQTQFEALWKKDHWNFEDSEYEQARFQRQLALVRDRRYSNVLEIGCGMGSFTRLLAPISERIVALDIAPTAIQRAIESTSDMPAIDFRVANVMHYNPRDEGPWDLVVLTETIYCLGWLYSFFDVGWLVSEMFNATAPGGRLLMGNTLGKDRDWLLLPWFVRTYRDLVANIGYEVENEEVFRDVKDGVNFEVLLSLFRKPSKE